MKVRKRSPRLTRLEKLTKGLSSDPSKYKKRFSVTNVPEKGRSLFLYKGTIKKDSFVLEYEGEIITYVEAEKREKTYEINGEGCYILFFKFQRRKLAIDATRCYDSFARYLNHSRQPNIKFHAPLIIDLTGNNVPRIAAYALKDIHEGDEIVFDYGVRDPEISWLKNQQMLHMSEIPSDSSDSESSTAEETTSDNTEFSVHKPGITCHPSHFPTPSSSSTSAPDLPSFTGSTLKTIPPGDYGWRLIPKFIASDTPYSYVVHIEPLSDPRRILRVIEGKCDKIPPSSPPQPPSEQSRPPSIISLSSNNSLDENSHISEESSVSVILVNSDERLPNNEPNSARKVLEWQCQNDAPCDIKILDVKSIKTVQTHTGSSSSSLQSMYSSIDHPPCTLPIISEVLSGKTVLKHFASEFDEDDLNDRTSPSSITSMKLPIIHPSQTKEPPSSSPNVFINPNCHPIPFATSSFGENGARKFPSPNQGTLHEMPSKMPFSSDLASTLKRLSENNANDPKKEVCSPQKVSKVQSLETEGLIPEAQNSPQSNSNCDIELIEIDTSDSSEEDESADSKIIIQDESDTEVKQSAVKSSHPFNFQSSSRHDIHSPQVAVIKPFNAYDDRITDAEREKLKDILGPHLLTDTASSHEIIQVKIRENWDFFKSLMERGVTVKDIRAVVRKFTKAVEKERRKPF